MKQDTRPGPQAKYSKHIKDWGGGIKTTVAERDRLKAINAKLIVALKTAADELKMAHYFNAEKNARALLRSLGEE